ncbi:MAG TPA: M20 family metallopeptidase [Terriglobales bacterium]|nr:M20 family metallopeptidase [Terriglobales bacterium]
MAIKQMKSEGGALVSSLRQRRDAMVETLRQMVELESPSDNKAAVDRLGEFLAEQFAAAGGRPKFHRQSERGNHLQVDFPGADGRRPVMLLGHFDTVWAIGTLAKMPWRVEKGRAWGPGSYDMKSGITLILHALATLREVRGELPRPVTVLLNTDEEIGSHTSRAIIERLARESAAVLIMEPSAGLKGAVKTARKGVGEYCLKVTGIPAHAGISPGEGASAIVELAQQIVKVSGFTDLKRGISVNTGVIEGGTRSNVVAAEASTLIDVRIARVRDAAYIDKKLHALRPANRKCRLQLTGAINRLPMERTNGVAALYAKARNAAAQLDWKLEEAATGGASDGNFTAALGVPTLDGLGGVGEGAHAFNESVIIEELPRRATLIALLIEAA